MGEYTRTLADSGVRISPEDENYREELLTVMQSFRTFDVALDGFLAERGYAGDLSDTDGKLRFLRETFERAGVPLDPRIPREWFNRHTRAEDRRIAFRFCFAFRLTLAEAEDFFRRVYLQRGIDCHDMEEAIYYYCIGRGLTYADAQALLEKAPLTDSRGSLDLNSDVLFTGSIIRELDRFRSPEELLAFLNENKAQFGYNNATAKKYINGLWERIDGKEGLAAREARRRFESCAGKRRSVWEIYLQIFGLIDYDDMDHSRLFVMRGDRTIQPMLKSNSLIHPIARKAFPDRQGLEKIIRGEYQPNEVVRKTMILLAFYRFWTERFLKGSESEYCAAENEDERCIAFINQLLTDAGYPTLYEGNPYDWIFLFAAQDEYPMETFRFFMRELYLNREENGAQ